MDQITVVSSSESPHVLSALTAAISSACDVLFDVLEAGFDKVSTYGIKSVQYVFGGLKTLRVDIIIRGLRQIELLVGELRNYGQTQGYSQDHIQSLILLQKTQLNKKLQSHTFFQEHFAWRVEEIFA